MRRQRNVLMWLTICLSPLLCFTAGASGAERRVAREALPSLTLDTSDLPRQPMLLRAQAVTQGSQGTSFSHRLNLPVNVAKWGGDVHEGRFGSNVQVETVLCDTSDQMDRAVESALMLQALIPELSGDTRFTPFSDRAWFSSQRIPSGGQFVWSARLIIRRANCVSTMYAFLPDDNGSAEKQFLRMAAVVARRIDNAAAGKPEPVPALPPSDSDLRCSLEDAWNAWNAVAEEPRNHGTIYLAKNGAKRKALPAVRNADGEWLVSLRYLVAAVQPHTLIDTKGERWAFQLSGKDVEISAGSPARVDHTPVNLRATPVIKNHELVVPISLLESVLDHRIEWSLLGEGSLVVSTSDCSADSPKHSANAASPDESCTGSLES